MLPQSLRTRDMEAVYQEAKVDGSLRPLEGEPRLKEWKYWFLIDNRFPYDAVFSVSHMLVLGREAGQVYDLTISESHELLQIRKGLQTEYDALLDNFPHKRSIPKRYHVHLVRFK